MKNTTYSPVSPDEQVRLTRPQDLQGYPRWRIFLARIFPVYESEGAFTARIWGQLLQGQGKGKCPGIGKGATWQEPHYKDLGDPLL